MAEEHKVKEALKKGARRKLHTDEVSYKRADNGGIHAKVERHTKEGHHHTEHHVLANFDDAKQHFQEHMGDQPDAGAQPSAPDAPMPPGVGGVPGVSDTSDASGATPGM